MKIALIVMILFAIGMIGTRYAFKSAIREHFGYGLAIAFGLCTLTGVMQHNPLVFMAACFVAQVVLIRTRIDAICRFFLLCVLTPNINYHVQAGSAYVLDLYVVDVLLLGLICGMMMAARRSDGRARATWTAEDTAMLAIAAAMMLNPFRADTITSIGRGMLVVALATFIPYFVISRAIADRVQFNILVAVIGGASMLLAVLAIYEAFFGWSMFEEIWFNLSDALLMTRNLHIRANLLRAPTVFAESTAFGLFQMTGVVAIGCSRAAFRSRGLWLGSLVLAILGLLAAQSRGADLGLIAAACMIPLFRRQFGRVLAAAFIAGIVVTLLMLAAPSNPLVASFLGSEQQFGDYKDYRSLLLERGIEEGMKHPLIGQDLPAVIDQLSDITQGEHIVDLVNTYLTFFLVSGGIGLGCILAALSAVLLKLWRQPRSILRDREARRTQNFAVGALVAVMVGLIFTSFGERNPYWLMIGLCAARIVRRGPADRPAADDAGPAAAPSETERPAQTIAAGA